MSWSSSIKAMTTTSKIPPFVVLTGTPALNRAVSAICSQFGLQFAANLAPSDEAFGIANRAIADSSGALHSWRNRIPDAIQNLKHRFNAATDLAAFAEFLENPPKPEPAYWSKPEDVPGPVCWIRWEDSEYFAEYLISSIRSDGVEILHEGKSCFYPWSVFPARKITHSTTRAKDSWKPCRVEVEG